MSRLVLLLEEESMRVLLDGLLPRLFPCLPFKCVKHEGKTDLERSIPRKLRAWREPGVRFAVVRDNDGGNCRARKEALRGICEAARRPDTLIRLACQELEAWYLGEPEALAEAFGREALRVPEWDVAALLKLMWETWNAVFRTILGPAERGFVGELRGHRNRWAHQEPFSNDDAYRALDTSGRLTTAVSASQAGEVEKAQDWRP